MIQLSYEDKRNVRLYYGEYDEDNIDGGQYSYKTLTRINHSPINMPSKIYSMIGSCNGLICFSVPRWGTIDDHVYICNPVTREYKRLTDKSFERVAVVNGFGYDPSSNEFKIVRIYLCELVQVYTLGSGSGWRNIGTTNYSLDYYVHPRSPMGVLVNGALHWLEYRKWRIVAFDLADEEFHVVPSPPCLAVGYTDYMNCFQLRKLGRCLCVVHQARSKRVDIWSLKKTKNNTNTCNTKEQEYEESWTWSREFSIKWETDFMDEYEPFALTKSGKVLLCSRRKQVQENKNAKGAGK
ncbi:F-box associated domain [Macleaya cordata]|uniref:F-box associated domain n=1 Tax=Macleaya cordata TaxID=56857 RepID=A0A200QJL3_MACCD|nr:F-box associated domain [Macleaya cordata]